MAQRVVPVIRTDSPPPAAHGAAPGAAEPAEPAGCAGCAGAAAGDMARLAVPGSFVSYLDLADDPVFRGTNNSAGRFSRHDSYR